ncbi:MAG: hypothetical protein K2M64_04205, partial [Clostridia bacterium]|nr:hypothetical protein [Clostridia bacterium]
LIPIIVGLALNIIGGQTDNAQLQRIGQAVLSIGVPVTMFVLVVACIVLMSMGKLSDNNDEQNTKQTSEAEQEYSQIDDVNTSYSYQSHNKKGDYISRHVANNYKNSTVKEKVLGWLFFGFLIGDFALIFVFAVLRNLTGIIVCLSIFAGTILISLIVKVILERTSMLAKYDKRKGHKLLDGEVKACLLSSVSSTSVGGSGRRSTTRIKGVIYRVIIVADDGQEYTAYTDNFYETGDVISFFAHGKRRATIVNEDELQDE